MNKKLFVILILGICTATFAQSPTPKISDLTWLAGCWEMKNESRGTLISEMWMKPAGGGMFGVGRTVRDKKVLEFEFLRIVEDANGLAYISRPSANTEDTTFKLLRSSANEITFENTTHDFPQRIIYKLISRDKLTARVEGTVNGKTRGTDFPYTRVKCEEK